MIFKDDRFEEQLVIVLPGALTSPKGLISGEGTQSGSRPLAGSAAGGRAGGSHPAPDAAPVCWERH